MIKCFLKSWLKTATMNTALCLLVRIALVQQEKNSED